jgi:DNA-binding transcriptional LysR family regulator
MKLFARTVARHSTMSRRAHKVSLEHLAMLDAVARHGSFAAAARELCVVTSSVTHAVKNLEEQLGLTLFDRSGRRARFTAEGRELLEHGRPLMAQAARFDADVQRLATGWESDLTLCVDQVIRTEPLMRLIDDFARVAPDTSLHLTREAVAGTWDALVSGRADLAVGAPGAGPPGGGYESAPLYTIRFIFAVAPEHPLARVKGVIPQAEIARHRAVLVADTTRGLPRWPLSLLESRVTLSVPDAQSRLTALLLGTGCGFVPARLAAPYVRSGRLVTLKVEQAHPPSQSLIAWRAGGNGRALQWWIARLKRPGVGARLIF